MTNKELAKFIADKEIVPLDIIGLFYRVAKANDDNIEMTEMFKKQLIEEGLYNNSYISAFVHSSDPSVKIEQDSLPIYGSDEKYVTKWFTSTPEETVLQELNDRQMQLKRRLFI